MAVLINNQRIGEIVSWFLCTRGTVRARFIHSYYIYYKLVDQPMKVLERVLEQMPGVNL